MNNDLKILIEFYKKEGRAPVRREIPTCYKLGRKYGSWNKALAAAGLPFNRDYELTEKELIDSIQQFAKNYKRSPTVLECRRKLGLYDPKTYFKKLQAGSWADVLRKAGLEAHFDKSPYTQLNDTDLLKKLKSFFNKNGTSSKVYKSKREDLPSIETLRERFGSWNNAVKKCGFEPYKFYEEEELKEIFTAAYRDLGRVPSFVEFKNVSGVNPELIKHRFGGWRKFIKMMGLAPVTKDFLYTDKSDEDVLNWYVEFSSRHGFKNGATCDFVDQESKTEGISAEMIIRRFGSINEARIAAGFKPSASQKLFTKEELLQKIEKVAQKVGRKPTNRELVEHGLSLSTLRRYLKKW